MQVLSRTACLAVATLTALGCGSSGEHAETLTIFFERHQDGQVLPLLAATRRAENGVPAAETVVRQLLAGPTNIERQDGFRPAFPSNARLLNVHRVGSTVVVDVVGLPSDDFYAAAAAVYSLTELPGIDTVSLRVEGRPCCIYDQASKAIDPLRRSLFRGWPGEPCELRTYTDAVRCRA